MKIAGLILKASLILAAAFLLLSCNALEKNTQSASMLVINSLRGTNLKGEAADYLQSDVLIEDATTGAQTITADSAIVNVTATLLEPTPSLPTSVYNDIQLERYVVTFSQPNGNKVEGRDVPYSFEGRLSALVKVGTDLDVGFIIVREVAKIEPPLIDLRDYSDILQVTAKIDFYGKDIAGKSVKATGYLTIFFANYAN
ncbi:MAG: hypothetical protein WCB96_04010 [Candidatus Aminicenantales bacterium]